MRRVLLTVLGLALLAGCGARLTPTPLEKDDTLPISPTSEVTVPPGPCVEFSTLGADAAMGLRVLTIEMVNCGAEPYTVNGATRACGCSMRTVTRSTSCWRRVPGGSRPCRSTTRRRPR